MEVIILAGGFGTRLRVSVSDVPKPMAPINGTPFLEILLQKLTSANVKKFHFSTHYKANVIEDHFGLDFAGVPINYVKEETPLGTGGAILNTIKHVNDTHVLVVNGDTYLDTDIRKFYKDSKLLNLPISIALTKASVNDRYGQVSVVENLVTEFSRYTYKSEVMINAGMYLIDLRYMSTTDFDGAFSLESDVFPELVVKQSIGGITCEGQFIDIGVPEDYKRFQELHSMGLIS